MTALANGYKVVTKASPRPEFTVDKLVAAFVIYEGGMTALDPTTGKWTKPDGTNPALVMYGAARTGTDSFDGTVLTTTELAVESGCFLLVGSGLSAANEGGVAYASDDQTFATSSSGTKPVLGWILEVKDSTHAYIVVDPIVNMALAASLGAAGDPTSVALTDASATITLAQGAWRSMPAATMTTDRTITVSTAGASLGSTMRITRKDLTAFHLSTVDGGAGTPTLAVMPGGRFAEIWIVFDGTNWQAADISSLSAAPLLAGTALTDAAAAPAMAGGNWYTIPAATLTAARAATVSTTGAVAGDEMVFSRLDLTGFGYSIINGGPGAGTLALLPGGEPSFVRIRFDGTNWAFVQVGQLTDDIVAGAALTDASANIQRGGRTSWRSLAAATLTAARAGTLVTTTAQLGDEIVVSVVGGNAFDYTITNGGGGGGNPFVFAAGRQGAAVFRFDGTNWIFLWGGTLEADAVIGAALTDAPSQIVRGGRKTWVTMPAATQSATRAITLPTLASSMHDDEVIVTRIDATANTLTFVDSGAGTPTILTMPASKVNSAVFKFNATTQHWLLYICGGT